MQRSILGNNAGVTGHAEFGEISEQGLIDVFRVNTFVPLLVTQALRAVHARGGNVVNITSVLGSIEAARDGAGYLTYGMSKAALDMFSVKLASTLRPHDICGSRIASRMGANADGRKRRGDQRRYLDRRQNRRHRRARHAAHWSVSRL